LVNGCVGALEKLFFLTVDFEDHGRVREKKKPASNAGEIMGRMDLTPPALGRAGFPQN
jgi:hypothetical protein